MKYLLGQYTPLAKINSLATQWPRYHKEIISLLYKAAGQ